MSTERYAYFPTYGILSEEAQKILRELTGIETKFKVAKNCHMCNRKGVTFILPHDPLLHQVYLRIGDKMSDTPNDYPCLGEITGQKYHISSLDDCDFNSILINDDEFHDVSDTASIFDEHRDELVE